ncbi:septum formation initiator family protein [Candidatus Avelusimicrobium fimicolum]|uniref:septum formation initiator family protein n=1 Tax=Candidatus Avelusimicrobium fimicolum TaxID=3416216 RepID=UPI003D0ADEA8
MKYFVLLFVLCLFGFMVVAMRIEINRSGRAISQLQNEVEIKEARNQYLELEISRLSGPQHVTAFAQDQLGLVPAKPHEIIILDPK